MSETQLIGKAKELQVASQLVATGLYVFFPLVDNGFDLVVTNKSATCFIPVQVKYKQRRSGFSLHKDDVKKFEPTKSVIAFGSADGAKSTNYWYIPIKCFVDRAIDSGRKDGMHVVYWSNDDNADWKQSFLNEKGIARAFKSLVANV